MNWVDYMGQPAVVGGCVSLQKSISALEEHKAPLTWAPWDTAAHLWVRVGESRQSAGSSPFGAISRHGADQTAPPLYAFIYSLSAPFLVTCRRRLGRAGFDVFHLSQVFWGTGVSAGISTAWNIHEYFGWQLKGLQRALDCAEQLGTRHARCTIYQHQHVNKSWLYME